ncbi:MAG: M20/M25/M40 family metallo-hydrolase [Polyangiales bacterium]
MNVRRALLVLTLLAGTSSVACRRGKQVVVADKPDAAPYATSTATPSAAFAIIDDLCTSVGARLAGSPGDAKAVAWATAKMHEFGLANVRTEPVTVPHWERGEASAKTVGASPIALDLAALGGSIGTPDAGLEAEVVMVPSLELLEKLDHKQLDGKIVFVNVHTRRARDGAGYGESVLARFNGPSLAAKRGAIGYLVRSTGTGEDEAPHTGAMKYADDAPKIPAAALGPKSADRLHDALKLGAPVRVAWKMITRALPDVQSSNVIGEVTGTAVPAEIVLIGAHLDSWDLGPGAQDDGAGVAIMLETMRRLRASPPRRTVRVALFANEENGVRGAKAYRDAHAAELGAHAAALEADMGAGRVFGVDWIGAFEDDDRVAELAKPLSELAVEKPHHGDRVGTDISFLRESGVPLFELKQDASTYFDFHHARTDTPAAIDRPALDQAVEAYVLFVSALANLPERLRPTPMVERGLNPGQPRPPAPSASASK